MIRALLLTVLIEAAFFMILGRRDRYSLTVIVCANVITNLSLNLFLSMNGITDHRIWLLLECLVVLAEYGVYALAFGRSGKLFGMTLAANCLSFGAGLVMFR